MYFKKALRPAQLKRMAEALSVGYKISVHRACEVTTFCRSMWYYKKIGRDDQVIRMRIKKIAETRVRYGSERIFTLLRREGFKERHNRVYRLYMLEGLNPRCKSREEIEPMYNLLEWIPLSHLHERWSIDFVSDQLFDGRKFRGLTIVNNYIIFSHDIS